MNALCGWISLAVGVFGIVLHFVRQARGEGSDFVLFTAALAAFVAGWTACFSLPALERRLKESFRCPKCHAALPTPHARQCLECGHDWRQS